MIHVNVPGSDGLCVAELELLLDDTRAFYRNYGDAGCRWVKANNSLTIPFGELRASPDWANLAYLSTFTGYDREGLHSKIEAAFGHALHDNGGHLRDGFPTTSERISETRKHVVVHFVAADGTLGDVNCWLEFDLVIEPVYSGGVITQTYIKLENVDPDSSLSVFPLLDGLLNLVLYPVLELEVDGEIERAIRSMGGSSVGQPPSGLHFCFPDYQDAGFGLCAGQ
jgi:hypothetical protein